MKFFYELSNIENKIILVEYDLFFNPEYKKYFHFVIDDIVQENKLQSVINEMKKRDNTLIIYVDIYNDFFDSKGNLSIYSDSLWIKTELNLQEIQEFFIGEYDIEPSDIEFAVKLEDYNYSDIMILHKTGIKDTKEILKEKDMQLVKTLYWD